MKRKTRRRCGGSSVIEMALTLPILLSLAFGTVEFGHYFFVKNTLQGAARDGCRTAILSGATNTTVNNSISYTMTAAGLQGSGYAVDIRNAVTNQTLSVSGAAAGTPIKVTVTCTWGAVGMRPLGLIGAGKQVQGVTIMLRE